MTAGDFIHQYNYEMFVLNHGVICTMKLQSYKTKTREHFSLGKRYICLCGSLFVFRRIAIHAMHFLNNEDKLHLQWIVEWFVQIIVINRSIPIPMLLLIRTQHVAEYILSIIIYSDYIWSWNELTKHPLTPPYNVLSNFRLQSFHCVTMCLLLMTKCWHSTVAVTPAKSC